jgi:hypothetical protein
MIGISAEIDQPHAGERFENLRNGFNYFLIASFAEIRHALDNFHFYT